MYTKESEYSLLTKNVDEFGKVTVTCTVCGESISDANDPDAFEKHLDQYIKKYQDERQVRKLLIEHN